MRAWKAFNSPHTFRYVCSAHERNSDFLDEIVTLWTPLDFFEVHSGCVGQHGQALDQLRVAGDFWRAISYCHGEDEDEVGEAGDDCEAVRAASEEERARAAA